MAVNSPIASGINQGISSGLVGGGAAALASPLDAITANIPGQRITATGGFLRPFVTGIVAPSPDTTSIDILLV